MSYNRDPWVVAEGRYLDGLSDEDRALYQSASAENLLYGTSAAQIRHEEKSKSRAAARKLQPLIAAVTPFDSSLDAISNILPLFMAPIWGGLRVLLHIAREFDRYYVKLIDMLERIGDVIPRFKSYEHLFSNNPQLLNALSAAYLDIIIFCTDAKDLFQSVKVKEKKSRLRVPGSGLRALKGIWKPFDQNFGVIIDTFRRHTDKVEMEAKLSHMIEEAVERKEQGIERDSQALERILADAERKRQLLVHEEQQRDGLLRRLSQCDQHYIYRLIKKMRIAGTGQWILNSTEFVTWLYKADSSCLWCYGIPGSGKSILTTIIIDTIQNDHLLDGASLAWFYCDYSEPKTLEPPEVVGSLIKQLLPVQLLKMSPDLQAQLEKIYGGGRIPDMDELLDMLSRAIAKFPKVFVIIDGLDECEERERGPLLQWLGALSGFSAATVKLFIASREEVDIKKTIGNSLSIQTTVQNVSSDISTLVQDMVNTRVAGERDWPQNLIQEIIDTLTSEAKGMFLWVTLQLDDICEELSEDGVRDALKRLPDGLNETFRRALQKIGMRGETQVEAARKLFMWLVGGKRILTLQELQEAMSIRPGDSGLERGRIPDSSQLMRVCGSLVVYDPQEKTIKLAHYTVQQFLLSQNAKLQLPNFHLDLYRSNAEIGQICMTYLCFSAFETQIIPRTLEKLSASDTMLLQSPTSGWVPQMIGLGQAQTTAWNFLRGNMSTGSTTHIDFTKYLQLVKKPAKGFMHEYKLLDYVIQFWVHHATSFTSEQPQTWRQFEHVALERNLFFNFKPWRTDNRIRSQRDLSVFRWALESIHLPLMRLVLDSTEYDSSFLSYALENDEHALCFASRMGHEQTLKILLPSFSRCFLKDAKTCTKTVLESIRLATVNGHDAIAAILVRHFQDLKELRPGGAMDKVFEIAVEDGHGQLSAELVHIGFGRQIYVPNRMLQRNSKVLRSTSKGEKTDKVLIMDVLVR